MTGPAPQGPPGSRRALRGVLRVTTFVLVIVVVVLAWSAVSAGADRHRNDAALAAARAGVAAVLSYDARSLDADLARARRSTTGAFTQQFDRMAATVIEPTARSQGTVTRATVDRVALVDAGPGQVRALVFVDQSTATASQPVPTVSPSALQVTLSEVQGAWLISGLAPL